jgi:hypothetical protein
LENPAELFFKETVLIPQLLFFTQGDRVIGLLTAGALRAVHAGRIVFALERFGWSKERHSIAAANFCFRSGVSAHEKKSRK